MDELETIISDLGIKGIQLEEPSNKIVLEKYVGKEELDDMPVFIEASILNGKQRMKIHRISGKEFFENL